MRTLLVAVGCWSCGDSGAIVLTEPVEFDTACVRYMYWRDGDGDGYGDRLRSMELCPEEAAGWVRNGEDCDDADWETYPGAMEMCRDVVDRDCDGIPRNNAVDPRVWLRDVDGDGFGGMVEGRSCSPIPGYVAEGGDCLDTDPTVSPGAPELPCDGIDQDCDGWEPPFHHGELFSDDLGALLFDVDPDFPVLVCPGEYAVSEVVVADNLTIIGMGPPGSVVFTSASGRHLDLDVTDLELTNLHFLGGSVDGDGGSVWARARRATFNGLAFSGSRATGNGGAVSVQLWVPDALSWKLFLNHVTFADTAADGDGGAVWTNGQVVGATIRVSNSRAGGSGGAFYAGHSAGIEGVDASDTTAGLDGGLAYAPEEVGVSGVVTRSTAGRDGGVAAGGPVGSVGVMPTFTDCRAGRHGGAAAGKSVRCGRGSITGTVAHLGGALYGSTEATSGCDHQASYATQGAAVWSGQPPLSSTEYGTFLDNSGGPAVWIDAPRRGRTVIKLGSSVVGARNPSGFLRIPEGLTVKIDVGADLGEGADDNGGFDIQWGAGSLLIPSPTVHPLSCKDAVCVEEPVEEPEEEP